MSNYRVAWRYAEALIELAADQNTIEAVTTDLQSLQNIIADSKEFSRFIQSPIIRKEKKQSVFEQLFKDKFSSTTMSFLFLLLEKNRESALHEITKQFFALRDKQLGIVNVFAKTAMELSDSQRKTLIAALERASRKTVRLNTTVDKSIHSGLIARIDDTVYDGSGQRQLELLRKRFTEI